MPLSRRALLGAAVALPLLSRTTAASALPAPSGVVPVLPPPTGRHLIGRSDLHLTDHSRRDPWTNQTRELMVTIYYPAARTSSPGAPYLSRGLAAIADDFYTQKNLGMPPGTVAWNAIRTHSRTNAPLAPSRRQYPVVVYQTQHLELRSYGTALAEELTSRGYVVVAMDSTHESFGVEFPDGRIVPSVFAQPDPPVMDPQVLTTLRTGDIRFVLDQLTRRFGSRLDLSAVGVYGQVGASSAGLQAAYEDKRVVAVAGLTDSIGTEEADWADVVHQPRVLTPFLLVSSVEDPNNHLNEPGWREFWPKLRDWKLNVQLEGSRWKAFGDYVWFADQIPGLPAADLQQAVGTMNRPNALAVQRVYLAAFFDLHLRGRRTVLDGVDILCRPASRFPELTFIR